MTRTLCATLLVLAVVCVGCGPTADDRPADVETPAATSDGGHGQDSDSSDIANEGFDAGTGEELQPAPETADDGGS
jgi:hypothetical protein